jgi:hypothetical protein
MKNAILWQYILQAVYKHIQSPSLSNLIFGKESALGLVDMSEDGVIQLIFNQIVFGSINGLQIYPIVKL